MLAIGYSNGIEEPAALATIRNRVQDITEIQIEELAEKRAYIYVTLRYESNRIPCALYVKGELDSYRNACAWLDKLGLKGVHTCKIPAPNQNTMGPNGS